MNIYRMFCMLTGQVFKNLQKIHLFTYYYGRDARLPTDKILNPTILREIVNLDDYRTEISQRLAVSWDCARNHIKIAQKRQKQQHDQHAKDPGFKVGERVFVYMPAAGQGEAYKLAKKFQGPFRILAIYDKGLELANINRPGSKYIRVALNRLRRCPEETNDVTKETRDNCFSEEDVDEESGSQVDVLSPWEGRLMFYLLGRAA